MVRSARADKGGGWGVGSGLVGLHLKGVLLGVSCVLSLGPWEVQSLQGQQTSRCQRIRIQKIRDIVNTIGLVILGHHMEVLVESWRREWGKGLGNG